jgi:hypothetical protein
VAIVCLLQGTCICIAVGAILLLVAYTLCLMWCAIVFLNAKFYATLPSLDTLVI